jgi:14-3-3 protein epsilon
MSSEREVTLFLAQVLNLTDRYEEMVDAMKKVIALDAVLNCDERNLLSVAYKNITGSRRNALRIVTAIIEHEEGRGNQQRVEHLITYKSTLLSELEKYYGELIVLIDTSLLPAAKYGEDRVFYEKLKADYYRYLCEWTVDPKKTEYAKQAKQLYEHALEIAKGQLYPVRGTSLGLILNYSVFLYEITGQRQEAIQLAEKTYNEFRTRVDESSDDNREGRLILGIMRDNVALWTQDTDSGG